MTSPENVFKGDKTSIGTVDIDVPLTKADGPCCDYYSFAFGTAALQAEQEGNLNRGNVYRFLQAVTSFHPNFDTPAQPYGPMWQMEGKRSLLPSDFTAADIEVALILAKQTVDPALRARLYDVLWELTKDHNHCAAAAENYIAAAERLDALERWTFGTTHYHRGLYLAGKLGREKELFVKAAVSLQQAARNSANNTELFRCCRYLELMIRFGCGDPVEMALLAAGHAQKAEDFGNSYAVRHYRDVEADCHRLAKNANAEKRARLAAAETYILEAEERGNGQNASALAASSILQNGIEALRRAGEKPERIIELRKRLNELQIQSTKEMKTVSTSVDISKAVEIALQHVKMPDFRDALFRFALGHPLSVPKEIREAVIQSAKNHPMMHLFGSSIMDEKGRITIKKVPLLNLKGQEFETELDVEMFYHVAQYHWPLRVSSFIEPARLQIYNDHHPTFQDIIFMVQNNPFIPQGHEEIFLRGIHAGFHGDFLVASHLLVPQIENSIRFVLESHSVDVSNLMSDGTQPVKILGALLGMTETKKIFGENLVFEFRGLLIEKTGYDFRNQLAHGFVSEGHCYSPAAITIWWVVLRILATPVFHQLSEHKKANETQQPPVNKA